MAVFDSLVNVILSEAKNLYHDMRDPSLALRVTCLSCVVTLGRVAKDILGEMPSPKRKERMTGQFHSYLNPKCDSGPFEEKGGCGVFAREPIRKGELLSLWGGRIVAES